jgi:predicted nucleic acid-binding protein
MKFVLDACAVIALLTGEVGAGNVRTILNRAYAGEGEVSINKINLFEVYYDAYRVYGKLRADDAFSRIIKLPLVVISELKDNVFVEAGRLKATYRVSLADSIALAEAYVSGALLVTSDHHEFDIIEQKESIKFHWIR